jgi:NAD(P)-dependent dehydrogenase (short-subunit alcohol dehydrogenase family)
MNEPLARHIEGTTALVTGANRGLGMAFVQALLDRGAAKVYAGARNPGTVDVTDARVVPVQLDITNLDDIAAAARDCTDVSLLINNAGAMLLRPFLSAPDMSAARTEMETNYFGTLAMARAFAPAPAAAGDGALVNMLSVVSWYASPFNASYCASKSAEWALTNALRVELRGQGTLVVGAYAGFIDTDMTATVEDPKISPREVAVQTLDAVEKGRPEVLTDDRLAVHPIR